MGEVRMCVPAGGPAFSAAAAGAAGAAAGWGGAAAGAGGGDAGEYDGGRASAENAVYAAGTAGCAAAWPLILRRNPERSTSRPCRWRSATSSINSLICSNVSKVKPLCEGRGRARSRVSGELTLQEQ